MDRTGGESGLQRSTLTAGLTMSVLSKHIRWFGLVLALGWLGMVSEVRAHPIPFSYLDLHIADDGIDASLVAHMIDLAHELGIDAPERLLNRTVARDHAEEMNEILGPRLSLMVGGRTLTARWTDVEVLRDRQSLRLSFEYDLEEMPGQVGISANLFPYDPKHQTFVNVYEDESLRTQAILDVNRQSTDYFTGTWQGTGAVIGKFVPQGVHHILIGPDHILFLVGLLLLGGSFRQLLIVVTAFTIAHSVTLSMAVLNVFNPPAHLVEPAIALSIVCVGADNLLVGEGRDMRPWIAMGFGLIHGFGFASVLRAMELPTRDVAWSLLSFNVGVELGQIAIVVVAAWLLSALRGWSEVAGKRLAIAGSIVVILAGTFWFVERVFFPGGIL